MEGANDIRILYTIIQLYRYSGINPSLALAQFHFSIFASSLNITCLDVYSFIGYDVFDLNGGLTCTQFPFLLIPPINLISIITLLFNWHLIL